MAIIFKLLLSHILFVLMFSGYSFCGEFEGYNELISEHVEILNKKLLFLEIIKSAQNKKLGNSPIALEVDLDGESKKHITVSEKPFAFYAYIGEAKIAIPLEITRSIQDLPKATLTELSTELSSWDCYQYKSQDDTNILWVIENNKNQQVILIFSK